MELKTQTLVEEALRYRRVASYLLQAARASAQKTNPLAQRKSKFAAFQELLKNGPMTANEIIQKLAVSRGALYQWRNKYPEIVENRKGLWFVK